VTKLSEGLNKVARPIPPENLQEKQLELLAPVLTPAEGVSEWVAENIVDEDGELYNPDHQHLLDADIAYLWASSAAAKKGRVVLGECENLAFRVGGWQKDRQQQQFREWFGHLPQFVITLAADYCSQCSNAEFCALVEHELYHIAQEINEFGEPKFTQEGLPKLAMRGHDVEEFIGVVRRYGPSIEVAEMVEAASQKPEVAKASIASACGTCLKAVA
jgi:hypothetical protein